MITQEEYEEAQEIVWDYENQLKEQGKAFDTSEETALNIDLVSESWYSKLKCLMEGLEINNIDLLLATGKNGDYRNLGKLMQKRIKELM